MKTTIQSLLVLATFGTASLGAVAAWAQDTGGGNADQGGSADQGGGSAPSGGSTSTTTTTYSAPFGFPAPGTNINAGLPSSSQPVSDTSSGGDSFDLNQGGGSTATVRGGKGASGVLLGHATQVPEIHTVRRGDTLWDLCGKYYENPYAWPRVWSYNPQIQNPHWIYPGDQVRMRLPGTRSTLAALHDSGTSRGLGLERRSLVPADTIFLRDEGYIDDPKKDKWGALVGSREDQMLLSEGNRVYMQMRPGVDLRLGQLLTIYRPLRQPKKVAGARKPPGEIVAIKGTVKIDQWDPDTHVARGEITESLDVIERGALVGPVGRRFDVVPPKTNDKTVWARVLSGIYPHVYLAQDQVVFIDRGSEDGLKPGNRLFIVRRGDAWRRGLHTATKSARQRMLLDSPGDAPVETTPLEGREKDFPDEVIGEIRVLRTRKYSSICMVTVSHRELVPGDRAVARKGY